MTEKNTKVKATSTGASFGKIMLASAVGVILLWVVLSLLSISIFSSIASQASKKDEIPEKSVLHIKLNREVVEQQQDIFDVNMDFLGGFVNPQSLGLNKILAALKNAKEDENIKGIYLEVSAPLVNLPELKEIKDAIVDFKSSGKFVIAHSDFYTAGAYYIASIADKVYITPTGLLTWTGFSLQVMYYKGLLEKLDVQPEIVRHGKFKSAVEPYLLDSISDENRKQLQAYIDNVWEHYVKEIADARNLDIASLNNYADKLMINSSDKAVTLGFFDQQKFRNDVFDEIRELIDLDDDKKINLITLPKYIEKTDEVSL
ncbi:MAG: S49 family peptidase, partial [Bacteroidota bacterium]|nr:S49 family peptidase [Bacteroidota bacterium]